MGSLTVHDFLACLLSLVAIKTPYTLLRRVVIKSICMQMRNHFVLNVVEL